MTTYTTNILLQEPVPLAASTDNIWGVSLNSGVYTLVDQAAAGDLIVPLTSGTIILTSLNGSPDQARNKYFNITGALSGNATILMPASVARFFLVNNQTTGAFTVSFGVNNGAGGLAGASVPVPPNKLATLWSDGTNVRYDGVAPNKALQQSVFVTSTNFTSVGSPQVLYLSSVITPIYSDSIITIQSSIGYLAAIIVGQNFPGALFRGTLYEGATILQSAFGGSGGVLNNSGSLDVTVQGVLPLTYQMNSPGAGIPTTIALYANDQNSSNFTVAATNGVILTQEWR